MCRSIKPLFNLSPPAPEAEVRAAALQFVRKVSGFSAPSTANAAVFDRAVDEVSAAVGRLLEGLVTASPPRDRDALAAKARARTARRFGDTARRARAAQAGQALTAGHASAGDATAGDASVDTLRLLD
jgi:hypothetical protein